ncbi:MAG TPA: DUF2155 domain-containing protein [Alphaproteobacteria bacterium]|nr:DUF2155 domain-containing protein [Alphaproteobacteria bacterium]
MKEASVRDVTFPTIPASWRSVCAVLAVTVGLGLSTSAARAAPDEGDTSANGATGTEDTHYDPFPVAVLRTLDKITGRAHTIQVPVDQETKFGTLRLTVKACYKRPPEETPETAAFLIIYDEKPDEPPEKVFSGWMFASSPALSALEHPVYDLWVLDCEKKITKQAPDQDDDQD